MSRWAPVTNLQLMSTQLACHMCTSAVTGKQAISHICQQHGIITAVKLYFAHMNIRRKRTLSHSHTARENSWAKSFAMFYRNWRNPKRKKKHLSRLSILTAKTVKRCLKTCVILFIFWVRLWWCKVTSSFCHSCCICFWTMPRKLFLTHLVMLFKVHSVLEMLGRKNTRENLWLVLPLLSLRGYICLGIFSHHKIP